MPIPKNTYRLQLHKNFSLSKVKQIQDYLSRLGVDTIYAGPICNARSGSAHGYDMTDPNHLNPEIGSKEEFQELLKNIKERGMHWLQDFVPNHMAFSLENPLIYDVLARGTHSPYHQYFDIDWQHPHPGLNKRLMTPFLGEHPDEAIKNGNLQLKWQHDQFVIAYFDNAYPVNIPAYPLILHSEDPIPEALNAWRNKITQTLQPDINRQDWLNELREIIKDHSEALDFIKNCVSRVNMNPQWLLQILENQHYALTYWRDTEKHINYRRFFTVNELICTRMEDPEVYAHYHQLIHEMVNEMEITGIRIDHIDGLYDPFQYLIQIRAHIGEDAYLTVEKILEPGEGLPKTWPVQGTTGYDFLGIINQLLTYPQGEQNLASIYHKMVPEVSTNYHRLLTEKKSFILFNRMAGELDNLVRYFNELKLNKTTKFQEEDLKLAIGAFLIHFPVYKIYLHPFPPGEKETAILQHTFEEARKFNPEVKQSLRYMEKLFTGENKKNQKEPILKFLRRCMQFTGPLMAKGGEDTSFYLYNRSLAQNEVGSNPGNSGIDPEQFHEAMLARQQNWPATMNATASHDTKRGEDARARLLALSTITEEWQFRLNSWVMLNQNEKTGDYPYPNDEYLIYQTLVAMVPFDGKITREWIQRLKDYLIKALREGKAHTNWSEPNEDYENAVLQFIDQIISNDNDFWLNFREFHQKIARLGIYNSLSQVILKLTCPGIPDLYQGCELWDLSLVDPDNRRPVDYDLRNNWLKELQEKGYERDPEQIKTFWNHPEDGKIKMWFTHQLLQLRNDNPDLFQKGQYIPLEVRGKHEDKVMAFIRYYKNNWVLSIFPLHPGTWYTSPDDMDWKNTEVILPELNPEKWENILDFTEHPGQQSLRVGQLFKHFPFAVLQGQLPQSNRGAGILMHITSLPSGFGIGDMGPAAFQFVNILKESYQSYWQVLPLTPAHKEGGYSPYGTESVFAGNLLLISPEKLAQTGLIAKRDLKTKKSKKVDYEYALKYKSKLFSKAYKNFQENSYPLLQKKYSAFLASHQFWLDDYALYRALKTHFREKPWYKWPEKIKFKYPDELEKYRQKLERQIEEEKFLQFLFWEQWQELKAYCNQNNISIIGDLPIYVNYDSADVWTHPEYFKLDQNLHPEKVAGVPPDLFSETGQLWGMPVFNWSKLKNNHYDWWINRLRHNLAQFDLIRLDHFRAFSAFWEVPSEEDTAVNGQWVEGPGHHFFNTLKNEIGELPFIAEDLGEIDDAVYELRDDFTLPGMQVLQFGFGDQRGISIHLPHHYRLNSIAYTGTHDNNTIKGWYRKEINKETRQHIRDYLGKRVTERNISPEMIREAYKSSANTVIIPMQDILELDEDSKMNRPGTVKNNWRWKMTPGQLSMKHFEFLKKWVRIYRR